MTGRSDRQPRSGGAMMQRPALRQERGSVARVVIVQRCVLRLFGPIHFVDGKSEAAEYHFDRSPRRVTGHMVS
jgi:hypothetical protein